MDAYAAEIRESYKLMATEEIIERVRAGSLTELANGIALDELASRGITDVQLEAAPRPTGDREGLGRGEVKEENHTWAIALVSAFTIFFGIFLVAEPLFLRMDERGDFVGIREGINANDHWSIIAGIILVIVAFGIHSGRNWARWTLCAMTFTCVLLSFMFLFGFYFKEPSFFSYVGSLIWFLPFLFTKKARLFFRDNSQKAGKKNSVHRIATKSSLRTQSQTYLSVDARSLALSLRDQRCFPIAKQLIENLGGTVIPVYAPGIFGNHISHLQVSLSGEHSFDTEQLVVDWVLRDVVPSILGERR